MTHMHSVRDDVDQELKQRSEKASTAVEWMLLEQELEAFSDRPDRLAELVISWRSYETKHELVGVRRSRPPMESAGWRADALSPWAAALAEKQVDVESWRWWHLGGPERDEVTLLEPDAVDGWITDYRWQPSRGDRDTSEPSWSHLAWKKRRGRRWEMAGGDVASSTVGGSLGHLVRQLERQFSWDQADATMFVLTGRVPTVRLIRAALHPRGVLAHSRREVEPLFVLDDEVRVDAFDRVVAELDPALTVDQVAAWWAEVRDSLAPAGGWRTPGQRSFVAARWAIGPGAFGTWAERQRLWNRTMAKKWEKVDDRGNFRRLIVDSVRRLLSSGR